MTEDNKPIKERLPQEKDGHEVQEVTQNSLLYDMEALENMTPEEWQATIDALPPEQQEEYLKEIRETAAGISEATMQAVQKVAADTAAITEKLQNVFAATDITDAVKDMFKNIGDVVQGIGQQLTEATAKILTFYTSDTFKELQETIQGFSDWYNSLMQKDVSEMSADELIRRGELTENLKDLLPCIQEETEAYKKETGRDQVTVEEFFRDTDPETGEPIESIYSRVLQRAQERAEEDAAAAEAAKNIISIGAHRVKSLSYPVDKVNNTVWGLLQENTHGQLTMQIKAEANSNKKQIDIIYSIDFDNIDSESPILKRLTQYDKRVYTAIGGLYDAGNDIVTIAMIYQAMGYRGEPGKADRDKINRSLTKMTARVYIDNWQEISAKYDYPKFKYDAALLPFERLTPDDLEKMQILIDGRPADEYVHLFREPPLLTFAKGRNQVTTIDQKLLQTPLSKTEQNMAIEDYCIERIAQYKREGKKILLSTLYKKCNITTAMQKLRAPEKLKKLFDYYKECGEITRYTITEDAIIFDVPKPAPQPLLPIKKK